MALRLTTYIRITYILPYSSNTRNSNMLKGTYSIPQIPSLILFIQIISCSSINCFWHSFLTSICLRNILNDISHPARAKIEKVSGGELHDSNLSEKYGRCVFEIIENDLF